MAKKTLAAQMKELRELCQQEGYELKVPARQDRHLQFDPDGGEGVWRNTRDQRQRHSGDAGGLAEDRSGLC